MNPTESDESTKRKEFKERNNPEEQSEYASDNASDTENMVLSLQQQLLFRGKLI